MNPEDYLAQDYLNSIKEYEPLVQEYFLQHTDDFLYGQKRNNCGVVSASFSLFAQSLGFDIQRLFGHFVTDTGVFEQLDFYQHEITDMTQRGLNPRLLEDRLKYVEINNLHERQKRIPHYWNIDKYGKIIDLSGYSQFIKTGLAQNLESKRYETEQKPNKIINQKETLKPF